MRATSSTTPWTCVGRDRRDRADELAGGGVERLEGGRGWACFCGGHAVDSKPGLGNPGTLYVATAGRLRRGSPDSLILSRSGRPPVRQRRSTPAGGPGEGARPRPPMLLWRCGCGRGRLEELVGQEHVLGEGSALRTAIEAGRPHSAILYGPPGSGKTTLAQDRRRRLRLGLRGGVGGQRRAGRDPGRDRAGRGAAAGERPPRRSSSSTRSTASTRPSRTRCCRRSRRAS